MLPYFFAQSANVIQARSVGICKTLPIKGNRGGPGGREYREARSTILKMIARPRMHVRPIFTEEISILGVADDNTELRDDNGG